MTFDTFITELENKAHSNTDLAIAYSNILLKLISIKNSIGFEKTEDTMLTNIHDVVLNDFKTIIDCRIRFCYNRINNLVVEEKDDDSKIKLDKEDNVDKPTVKINMSKLSFGVSPKKK